jgi:very-short-patch-repair endonuclease
VKAGFLLAPLPVFIEKGVDGTYRRCEPDFIVVRYGIWAVVEVDGENWHHETPQQAHARLQGFEDQGARVIRVPANIASGPEWAKRTVDYIAERFEKFKLAR